MDITRSYEGLEFGVAQHHWRHLWKVDELAISRAAFEHLYRLSNSSLTALRDFLVLLHTDQTATVNFSMARLATLRPVSAGLLLSYGWTIDISQPKALVNELHEHLRHSSGSSQGIPPFLDIVSYNLGQLMIRYRCKLFRLP